MATTTESLASRMARDAYLRRRRAELQAHESRLLASLGAVTWETEVAQVVSLEAQLSAVRLIISRLPPEPERREPAVAPELTAAQREQVRRQNVERWRDELQAVRGDLTAASNGLKLHFKVPEHLTRQLVGLSFYNNRDAEKQSIQADIERQRAAFYFPFEDAREKALARIAELERNIAEAGAE